MIKWTIIVLAVLITPLALAALVGLGLPQSHVASRSRHIAKSPEQAWQLITDVERYGAWRPGVTKVERLPEEHGRVMWRETSGGDAVRYRVIEAAAPSRFVTEIADSGLPYGGRWEYDVEPDGTGSRVTITERGEVYNPIFRTVSRFILGHTATIDKTLDALERA